MMKWKIFVPSAGLCLLCMSLRSSNHLLIGYGSPSEITAQSTGAADVRRLLSVAVMAIKYNFESLGKWCISVINYHCDTSTFISDCSDGDLERLAHIAYHDNIASSESPSPLLRTLQTKWLKLLKDNEQLSVNLALDVGEKYKWDTFRGILYHREALRMCSTPPQGNRGVISPLQALNLTHDRRVLAGFASLSLFWDRFASRKVPFVQLCDNQEYHRTHCNYYYNLMWAEIILSATAAQNVVNVTGRIMHMHKAVPSVMSYKSISARCQQQILDGLLNAYDELVENLPYHFLM